MSFYDTYAEEFIASTLDVDMTALYEPFLAKVPKGGRVLDAGCGPGRDARAFLERGFVVEAFDASPAMSKFASDHTGLEVEVLEFTSFSSSPRFDGVWACASLLHVPRTQLVQVGRSLVTSLLPGGVLYASFKRGEADRTVKGRHFTDLTSEAAETWLAEVGLTPERIWLSNDVRKGREEEQWVNILACRFGP